MSDRELRKILLDTIRDIDEGRVVIKRPRRSLLHRLLAPGLIAASVGAAACGGRTAGGVQDATVPREAEVDVRISIEYGAPWEAGIDADIDVRFAAEYGIPFFEAGTDAGDQDASIDAGDIPLYMGPPPDDR
jgi:hypothetical protein